MPSGLLLDLLGPPRLRDGAGREQALPSRRALALLAVIAAEGEVPRSRVATLFWASSTTPARAATCAGNWRACAAKAWKPPSAPSATGSVRVRG